MCFYNKIHLAAVLLVALCCVTSCSEDDRIGYEVSGHWFGDMDMYFDGERARGSEIEFKSNGWGYDRGTGVEIDYYRFHTVTNYFNWRVSNRVIYFTFDDPALDCAIVDYSLSYDYFRGYIADYNTLENLTYFNLRNYERYWNNYGYSYSGYYVKGTRTANDSTAISTLTLDNQSEHVPGSRGIRGIYLKQQQ